MRHAISVLLQNEVGALTRMTGMFSSRGYNIESLNVAPTNDETVSRVTLVVSGSDAAIAQLNTQLAKLVDVVNIHDMTLGEHFERELAIITEIRCRDPRRRKQQLHAAADRVDRGNRRLCRGRREDREAVCRRQEWQRRGIERRGHTVVL
jgi:acetolactate synthase small subunit